MNTARINNTILNVLLNTEAAHYVNAIKMFP